MSDAKPWKAFTNAQEEIKSSEISVAPQQHFVDFDINGRRYRITTEKTFSDEEKSLKTLVPSSILKQELFEDNEIGRYFLSIANACSVRTSAVDKVELLDTFTRTLNNLPQIRRFMSGK
jgi:hypothetical protein